MPEYPIARPRKVHFIRSVPRIRLQAQRSLRADKNAIRRNKRFFRRKQTKTKPIEVTPSRTPTWRYLTFPTFHARNITIECSVKSVCNLESRRCHLHKLRFSRFHVPTSTSLSPEAICGGISHQNNTTIVLQCLFR